MDQLVIRYRKGTRHNVNLDLIESLKRNIEYVNLKRKERNERVEQIKDGAGWGIAIDATWIQLLSELVHEFERITEYKEDCWRPILTEFILLICQDRSASDIWPPLREFIHKNVESLSGWRWNFRSRYPFFEGIYRRDGQYLKKKDGEEMIVYSAKTALEERIDFVSGSISGKRSLLHLCLKTFALTNIERHLHHHPDSFPKSVKIELGEGDHYTYFLQWRWAVKWPYQMRPLEWRPDDNYCDPNRLSTDLITFVCEVEKLEVGPEFAKPDPSLVQKWTETFGKAKGMYSFALETDLQMGDELEAWFDFRGHKYRWINATASSYPVLIATYAGNERENDVELRAFKTMSHVSFVFDTSIKIHGWVGSINRFNPATSNPRRRGYSEVVPSGYFEEVKGKDPARLDFALSFYREGASSSSPFYRFLNFYKIIQFAFGEKANRITTWIEANAPKMSAFKTEHFQNDFTAFGNTVTEYLYEANRNAIAHVNLRSGQEVVDPDNVTDLRRVNSASYLVKDLAQEAINTGLF